MSIKTWLRNFDRYRRRKMAILEPLWYRLFLNSSQNQSRLLQKEEVSSILIIRNNKRIGNILFLIPFIKQVRSAYPDAKITLLLSQSWQKSIFENIGIDEILVSNFSFSKFVSCLKLIKSLRQKNIDLMLIPYSSSEDSFIASVLPAKNKISSHSENRNICFTHTFKSDFECSHMAFNKLFLIKNITNEALTKVCHKLVFSESEELLGMKDRSLIYDGNKRLVAFFRGARGKKKLSDQQWKDILIKFEEESIEPIQWVEILSSDINQPLSNQSLMYQNNDLRLLASFLKNVDTFISCDTGPLHLADAAGVNCIGLFTHTNSETYGVINGHSLNLYDWYHTGVTEHLPIMAQ
ncbi:glycosyltransferase family 9 protein [Vibrio sp.]|uniref:glycosyltransferase family 9 protein n=1 Tax=Vibrio sp. TaxID=678 RepID=UPI003AA970BF